MILPLPPCPNSKQILIKYLKIIISIYSVVNIFAKKVYCIKVSGVMGNEFIVCFEPTVN